METFWHNLTTQQAINQLESHERGLTGQQVELRRKKFGKNQLPKSKPLSKFKILLSQFTSPLVYVLLFAALVSLYLRELTDFGVITLALIVNTVVGYIQENKANNAINQLRKLIHPESLVVREGEPVRLDTAELVPGDILILEAGDRVGADARIIEYQNLQLIEAMLTGESAPSDKSDKKLDKGVELAERENMVYMGTVVGYGRGKAVVTQTGIDTEIGKITKLIKHTREEKTPLQKNLLKFSRQISIAILLIAIAIVAIGLLRGFPIFPDHATGQEGIFNLAVAIAVAAIPEGLLVAVTVVLAVGLQAILKKKALVRRMLAVETIGATSVICTDKTGTLTLGEMKVDQIITFNDRGDVINTKASDKKGLSPASRKVIEIGMLCNNAIVTHSDEPLKPVSIVGMPTEKALIEAGLEAGLDKVELEKEHKRVDEIPFTSEEKYMATLNAQPGLVINVKGAPEKVLGFCARILINGKEIQLSDKRISQLKSTYEKATSSGLRLLALAYKNGAPDKDLKDQLKDLTFAGLVALKDPLRPEAKDTIALTRQAGIKTVIITGDHPLTAKAIVAELGFDVTKENVLVGAELDKLTDDEFKQKVKDILIYARTEPRHKIRIVNAWQSLGEVVAMTGDGINDSPAVKKANVGIVVGSGTEVAKEAADIILLDNNFKTIADAIWQGRTIFENIKKIILYLLTDSFSEVILVSGALLFGLPLPVTAVQILWINLITDGLPGVALTFEPGEEGVKEEQPRKPQKGIFDKEMKFIILLVAIVVDVLLLSFFFYLNQANQLGLSIEHIRTIIFASLGIDSLFYVFSIRTMRKPIFRAPLFNNKILNYSILAGFALQLMPIYIPFLQGVLDTVPLTWEWIPIMALTFIKLTLIETVKHIFHRPQPGRPHAPIAQADAAQT